jgi:hypothetical protein
VSEREGGNGHVLRTDNNRNAMIALNWKPEGKRSRGRPKETWRRTVEKGRKELGLDSWAAVKKCAEDRSKWKEQFCGLASDIRCN